MTYEDAINTFRKHLNKISQWGTDFDVWLSTAIEHVHEIFTILSPQYNSITQIKNDYSIAKIGNKSPDLVKVYAYKASQLLESFIEQLEEKKRIAVAESTQKQQAEARKEIKLQQHLDRLTQEYNGLFGEKTKLENELKGIRESQNKKRIYWRAINGVYHINVALFWTVFPLVIALTVYLASLKFDNDKINLFEKNQELKSDTARLSNQLKIARSEIESRKSKQSLDTAKSRTNVDTSSKKK